MKGRLISSTILITITVLAMLNEWIFLAGSMAMTVGALYEFFSLIKKKGIPIYSYTGLFIGTLIPLSAFFKFEPTKGWELLFIVLLLLMIFIMQLIRNDNTNAII